MENETLHVLLDERTVALVNRLTQRLSVTRQELVRAALQLMERTPAQGLLFDDSLYQARQLVAVGRKRPQGIECPCCELFVKEYDRPLNSGQVRALVWLVGASLAEGGEPEGWVDVPASAPRHVIRNRELGRLVHWRLVEPRTNDDATKRDSGYWRPTARGVRFVLGLERVPRSLWIFNNEVIGEAPGRTTAEEVLRRGRFNYHELMRAGGLRPWRERVQKEEEEWQRLKLN